MARRLPSLNALRAFESVARHRSFARAAEELHVTPAAVSQLVKQLEASLDMVLFKRGKLLTLSAAAAAAVPLITEAFDRLERAVEQLHTDSDNGTLVVSAPPVFAARWLIPRLDDFQTRYPEIELRLLATRRVIDFALEDVDVAVRFGAGSYAGLFSERIMQETIVPVAAPAQAATIASPADLLNCTLLQGNSHEWDPAFPDWETWLATLSVSPVAPPRIRHFGDVNLVIQAAASGLGVALAWRSLVADELQSGRLVALFDTALPTDRAYHLVTLNHRQSLSKVLAFRHWLQSQAVLQSRDGAAGDAV
jgi:LysR family transcriptional regulator, glycine cleavage system transcriptional activator